MAFFHKDDALNPLGDRVLQATWAHFPQLARDEIALTWILYDPPYPVNTGGALTAADFWQRPARGFSYRGIERFYPASLAKLFYMVAVHDWLDKGMLAPSPELDRALHDAIVDSSNDATSLLVDALTGTTSGPELSPEPFRTWQVQRNLINRYLQGFQWEELAGININQKTWCDGPYGRERAFLGPNYENRNALTTEAIARLLHAIVGGVAVSSSRSQAMMALMSRSLDPADVDQLDPDYNQISGFLGAGLPPGSRLWSKAGWTSKCRHDAAYVELPDGQPYLLVVAIDAPHLAEDNALLPFISSQVAAAAGELAAAREGQP